jgi:hypothetical protein
VQSLRRLIAPCSPCHLTTHFGYANVTGRTDQALAHLRTVTGMTDRQAWAHIDAAQNLWISRSRRTWELDLNILTGAGITLARPEPPRRTSCRCRVGPPGDADRHTRTGPGTAADREAPTYHNARNAWHRRSPGAARAVGTNHRQALGAVSPLGVWLP